MARLVAVVGTTDPAGHRAGSGESRSGGTRVGGTWGADRSGLASRGDLRSLSPWQWCLPPAALAARERRGEAVYRNAKSAEAGSRPPVVVVLDAGPGTWGPAGGALRAAASAVLENWWRAGSPAWLFAAGDPGRVWEVRNPGDWAGVWALWPSSTTGEADAVRAADRVRHGLGRRDGVLVVLSHVWFGADVPRVGRTAAVLIRPPGGRGAGPRAWADRWTEVSPDPAAATAAAFRLLGQPW